MRNLRFLMLALAASLAFTGCSSGDDDEGDGTLLLGGFIDQVFLVQAAKYAECVPAFSTIYLSAEGPQAATAKADMEASVAAGRMVYRADKANECLQQLRAMTCVDLSGEGNDAGGGACELVFEAKVAAGGDCYMSEECVNGHCVMSDACPGKCEAFAMANESCATARCGDDLYCDGSSQTCLARKAAGADCTSGSECLEDLACLDGKCGVETETLAGAGETCGNLNCAEGFYCDRPSLFENGTCVAVKAAGAECGEDYAAAYSECGDKLACAGFSQDMTTGTAVKGKCTAWADIGADCTVAPEGSMGISGCKLGLVCQSGKCAAPPSSGACLEDELFECDPRSAYCDDTTQCVAKKANGAACESGSECQSGDCVNSLCDAGCRP